MGQATETLICKRCGIDFTISTAGHEKRIKREDAKGNWCSDCRGAKAKTKCKPHDGEFCLDTFRPIDDDGNLVKPGVRMCKNEDCMNDEHIIPAHELERIRPQHFRGTDKELVAMLFGEQPKPCKLTDCFKPAKALGFCAAHYIANYRVRRKNNKPKAIKNPTIVHLMGLEIDTSVCLVPECDNDVHAKNLCHRHYVTGLRRLKKLKEAANV